MARHCCAVVVVVDGGGGAHYDKIHRCWFGCDGAIDGDDVIGAVAAVAA